MTQFDYNLNVPFANNNPSVDQPDIELNTNSVAGWVDVDHNGFNTANPAGGTHAQVQMFNTPPGNGVIPVGLIGNGYETLYSSVSAAGGDIWMVRGGAGAGFQLTGPFIPNPGAANGANGFTFIAGGVLVQWGTFKLSGGNPSPTILFATSNVNFPNYCFNVQVTFIGGTVSPPTLIAAGSVTKTGFQLFTTGFATSGANAGNFQWLAIGA